jgi:hypothetical protein
MACTASAPPPQRSRPSQVPTASSLCLVGDFGNDPSASRREAAIASGIRASVEQVLFALLRMMKAASSIAAVLAFMTASPSASLAKLIAGDDVLTLRSAAGLPISSGLTYSQTLRFFRSRGDRVTRGSIPMGCYLKVSRLEMRVDFEGFRLPGKASCSLFGALTVTSRTWRTSTGLRVGDSVTTLRHLFPRATNFGGVTPTTSAVPGSVPWGLTTPPGAAMHPWLLAYVAHARVVGLGILMVGH